MSSRRDETTQARVEEHIGNTLLDAILSLAWLPRDYEERHPRAAGMQFRRRAFESVLVSGLAKLDEHVNGKTVSADKRDVYFVQAGNDGPIKVGVAGNPQVRLRELQTASPVQLRLLGVIPGIGQPGELALHERFAAARSQGEWFRPVPELLAFIESEAQR